MCSGCGKRAKSVDEKLAINKEQAEDTAKDAIRQLQESLDHGFMTFPELIRILEEYHKKAKLKMNIFRV